MANKELQSIAEFCRDNWSDYCDFTIKTADRVCENRFLFDSPRDMERTESTVDFGKKSIGTISSTVMKNLCFNLTVTAF